MSKLKTIVLTRSVQGNSAWRTFLRKHGFRIYELPSIETVAVRPNAHLKRSLASLAAFDWIIFTSAAGPFFLKEAAAAMNVSLPSHRAMPKIAAIGEKTAEAVRRTGYPVSFTPLRSDGKSLARQLRISPGSRVLLLRADIAAKELPDILKKRGAHVSDLSLYKTKLIRKPADKKFKKILMNGMIDYIVFASPSAVRGFLARLNKKERAMARNIPAIAAGKTVGGALAKALFKDIRRASEPTVQSIRKVLK